MTWFLSRQILTPVRALQEGTQALICREFEKRIAVRSQDELGRLSEDFNTLASTLQHYETLRQQWITDISHELRTPLAVLRGEIEALQDGVREVRPEAMASLHTEVDRLATLVEGSSSSLCGRLREPGAPRRQDPPRHRTERDGKPCFETAWEKGDYVWDLDVAGCETVSVIGDPGPLEAGVCQHPGKHAALRQLTGNVCGSRQASAPNP